MRSNRLIAIGIVLLLLVSACAGSVQQAWDKLSPSEKARIVLNGLQGELNTLFDEGMNFIAMNPEKEQFWKEKAVPAFDTANVGLRVAMITGLSGGKDLNEIMNEVGPLIDKVKTLLVAMGVELNK